MAYYTNYIIQKYLFTLLKEIPWKLILKKSEKNTWLLVIEFQTCRPDTLKMHSIQPNDFLLTHSSCYYSAGIQYKVINQ